VHLGNIPPVDEGGPARPMFSPRWASAIGADRDIAVVFEMTGVRTWVHAARLHHRDAPCPHWERDLRYNETWIITATGVRHSPS